MRAIPVLGYPALHPTPTHTHPPTPLPPKKLANTLSLFEDPEVGLTA